MKAKTNETAFKLPQPLSKERQLFLLSADSRDALTDEIRQLVTAASADDETNLTQLAFTTNCGKAHRAVRIALLASTIDELRARASRAIERLSDPDCHQVRDVQGIYFTDRPLYVPGRLAFLFPGEGAHYAGMLCDLRRVFPEAERVLRACEQIESDVGTPVGMMRACFSMPGSLSDEQLAVLDEQMERFSFSVLTVLVASWQLLRVLEGLKLEPDMMVGHSSGETSALYASGTVSQRDPRRRGAVFASMMELDAELHAAACDSALLAVGADRERVAALIGQCPFDAESGKAYVAMDNCPHQTVVVGTAAAVSRLEEMLQTEGMIYQRLAIDGPVHTPLFQPYIRALEKTWTRADIQEPATKLYSCATAAPFPDDPDEIYELANTQWQLPVDFTGTIHQMYDDGARIFVEVGPRGNLSAFVEDILRGKPALIVPADVMNRTSTEQCNHLVAQLFVHQVPMDVSYLYQGNDVNNALVVPPSAGEKMVPPASRQQAMLQHQALMHQFLEVQQTVVQAYLRNKSRSRWEGRPQSGRRGKSPNIHINTATPDPPPQTKSTQTKWTLVDQIVDHQPGQAITMRRPLDIHEDLYADQHTVGGQSVSAVNPRQHGLPIMPMTFFLEMMSQTAATLFPGYVVTAISRIKLRRWLAFYADDPGTSEVTLERVATEGDRISLKATVTDLGDSTLAVQDGGGIAATADLVVEPAHTETAPTEFHIENPRPCTVTLKYLYDNLFHGPVFQGVRSLHEYGDKQIRGEIEVLPRETIFASTDDPIYLFDPATLDVSMHPLAGWHLEQPDQTGRIMLPYELDKIEFFTEAPRVGERMICHGQIGPHGARHFTHSLEVVRNDGRLWCRLTNIKCWRFYLPFNEVNFHGPKNIYYLSSNWLKHVERPSVDSHPLAGLFSETSVSLMRMEPPDDLQQPAIQIAASRVIMSPNEQRYLEEHGGAAKEKAEWIFERGVCKDAVRRLWEHCTGEKLFAADVETGLDENGRLVASPRDPTEKRSFPSIANCSTDQFLVATAHHGSAVGLDVVEVVAPTSRDRAECVRRAAGQVARAEGFTTITRETQLTDEIWQVTINDEHQVPVWSFTIDDHLVAIALPPDVRAA